MLDQTQTFLFVCLKTPIELFKLTENEMIIRFISDWQTVFFWKAKSAF